MFRDRVQVGAADKQVSAPLVFVRAQALWRKNPSHLRTHERVRRHVHRNPHLLLAMVRIEVWVFYRVQIVRGVFERGVWLWICHCVRVAEERSEVRR